MAFSILVLLLLLLLLLLAELELCHVRQELTRLRVGPANDPHAHPANNPPTNEYLHSAEVKGASGICATAAQSWAVLTEALWLPKHKYPPPCASLM